MTEQPSAELAARVLAWTEPLRPEVQWDRWVGDADLVRVYGWVARPDGAREDFVLLDITPDGAGIVTSNRHFSEEFARRLGMDGEHSPCRVFEEFVHAARRAA